MEKILEEIKAERYSQNEKWGIQNHPILDPVLINRDPKRMCEEYEIPTEGRAKTLYDINFERNTVTWMHILIEEVCEVASCKDDNESLRRELIQCGAVIVAMIESLDRNKR